jgi:uncharacterized membrane protein YraQ (UPF0718 family)
VPADLRSVVVLILLNGADAVARLWPYVLGGIAVALLLSWLARTRRWIVPFQLPRALSTPVAAIAGAASPLPTVAAMPLALKSRRNGLPTGSALAFVLASSLMNPQVFFLTLGALGALFALAQLGTVLVASIGLGLLLGVPNRPPDDSWEKHVEHTAGPTLRASKLAGHVGFYFLVGVLVGSCFQVLLPHTGMIDWLGSRGWLSTPFLGWLGAPLYTCGGSAIPMAGSLLRTGFSPGALFAFLLIGPSFRGTTLANLSSLLPKRALVVCLATLALVGGLIGLGLDWLMEMV